MPKKERNLNPPEAPGAPSEPPAPQQPEEALSDKLAETAGEVKAGLQDLLPEQRPAEPAAELPAEPVEQGPAELSAKTESLEGQAVEPAVEEAEPAQPPAEKAATAELPPAPEVTGAPVLVSATAAESTSDDRLMSMLAWLTMAILQLPIVSIIQLVSTSTKDRPFQRHHAITSLLFYVTGIAYEIIAGILYAILGTVTLGCGFTCLWVIFFVPQVLALYFALQAYNGKLVELPVLSDFARQQKWL